MHEHEIIQYQHNQHVPEPITNKFYWLGFEFLFQSIFSYLHHTRENICSSLMEPIPHQAYFDSSHLVEDKTDIEYHGFFLAHTAKNEYVLLKIEHSIIIFVALNIKKQTIAIEKRILLYIISNSTIPSNKIKCFLDKCSVKKRRLR